MENILRARPRNIREQYERQFNEFQEAYGEALLELRARKELQVRLGEEEKWSGRFPRDCGKMASTS